MAKGRLPSPAGVGRDPEFKTLEHHPLVRGRSADPRVGEFEGQLYARQRAADAMAQTRYLVLDRRRQRLFWVAESDIDAPPEKSRPRALGYVLVPVGANGSTPVEVGEQTKAIQRAADDRGLELVCVIRDVETPAAGDLARPGLHHVLEQIVAGEASCMVVAGLERLGRSAAAVGTLVSWFERDGRRLVAADLELDTHTKTGKVAARALAAAGELEGRKLADRTRRGLAAARAKGTGAGPPSVADRPELRERIALMRAEGMTLQAIADRLNAERVSTLRGGSHWRPSSVQAAAGYKRPGRARRIEHLPGSGGLRPTGT